jgi:hypothetical protein
MTLIKNLGVTAMERADALVAAAAETLAEDFEDFLFPELLAPASPKLEDHWALGPFLL